MTKDELKEIRIANLKEWFKNRTLPVKDKSLISQLMSGKSSFGEKVSRRLEEEYGMGHGYLDSAKRPIESNATVIGTVDTWDSLTPLGEDDAEVPFYKEIHLSAGNGFADDIEDHNGYKLRFSRATLRRHSINPADVVCVSADGNSMEPVFPDGATLGINTADKTIKDGKIYAINHGGLLRTKILQKLPDNKVRIKSYNTAEFDYEEADLSEITIIGRVFWWSVLD